jgi:Pectate lyase superfamily protein
MSVNIDICSTNPSDYLNSLSPTSGGGDEGVQLIDELIAFVEEVLMQMLFSDQTSSPPGDMGDGQSSPSSCPMPKTPSTRPTSNPGPTVPPTSNPGPTVPPTRAPGPTVPPTGASGSPGASTSVLPQPPNSINVADYGAIGNGTTDDTQALQNAFNAAAAQGKSVYIPPGTYNHSGTLSVNGVNVTGSGSQTMLVATNPSEEAIKLGSNSSLSNVETFTSASTRDSQPDEAAVDVTGSNDTVSNVTTLGAESNGIRLDGATGATISHDLVEGSNADGIAVLNGSSNNSITGDEVYQAGDDSFSDDSYTFDSKQDSNNTFEDDFALGNSYGRSFALLGSTGDTIENSVSEGSKWMGIVAGTDSNSQTLNGSDDTIENNLILNPEGDDVDVMGPGGTLSQSGDGIIISGNSSSGSVDSVLDFDPATDLTDRSQINSSYQPGTGNGAHN